jgi:hypothetical protein
MRRLFRKSFQGRAVFFDEFRDLAGKLIIYSNCCQWELYWPEDYLSVFRVQVDLDFCLRIASPLLWW